jgi:very-short-patch-repair endonuclease
VPHKKREIQKVELLARLEAEPDVTLDELKTIFQCGSSTIARELKRHGLKTKGWEERTHTAETKDLMSRVRTESGSSKGDRNPNYGSKPRPWLVGDRHPLRRWHKQHPDFGARQRGASNPIHRVIHLYEDQAYVERITAGIRQHIASKTGKSYEEVYGEAKAAEYKEKLRLASPQRLAKFKRKRTGPEKLVSNILTYLGVSYTEQTPLGYYTVDFLVPPKLVIQTDGDYWHGNPKVYSELSDAQRQRKRLDASCDSFLQHRGYTVLRLWEHDLKHDLQSCVVSLITALVTRYGFDDVGTSNEMKEESDGKSIRI